MGSPLTGSPRLGGLPQPSYGYASPLFGAVAAAGARPGRSSGGWAAPWPAGGHAGQQYDNMIEDVIKEILGNDEESPKGSGAGVPEVAGSGQAAAVAGQKPALTRQAVNASPHGWF